jgi:hypothetical protein
MEISEQLTCPCRPNFTYKNLTQHKKSKMHLAWEAVKETKDIRINSKQFENEIERLKRRMIHKEAVELALMNRIRQLEEEVLYWKTACDGVYVN